MRQSVQLKPTPNNGMLEMPRAEMEILRRRLINMLRVVEDLLEIPSSIKARDERKRE